ncbi:MAG: hypothetical protein ACFFD4_14935 [Candidatus Odinarchaeota archaeon]
MEKSTVVRFRIKFSRITNKGKGMMIILSFLTIWAINPEILDIMPVQGYNGTYSEDFTTSSYKDAASTDATGWGDTYDRYIPESVELNLTGYVYVSQCSSSSSGSRAGIFVNFYNSTFSKLGRVSYEFAATKDLDVDHNIVVYNQLGTWLTFKRDVFQDYKDEFNGNPYDVAQLEIGFCVLADDGPNVGDSGYCEAYFDDWNLSGHTIKNRDFESGLDTDWDVTLFNRGISYDNTTSAANPYSGTYSYHIYAESYHPSDHDPDERYCKIEVSQNITLSTGENFVTNPRKGPELVGSVDTQGKAVDVVVEGDYAYVADANGTGVQIINISNLEDPSLVSTWNWGIEKTPNCYGVDIDGDWLLVTGDESVIVLDISNASEPEHITNISTPGIFPEKVNKACVRGHLLYVATDTALAVVTKEDLMMTPSIGLFPGNYSTPGRAMDVFATGDVAAVADDTAGLILINIITQGNPTLLSTFSAIGGAYGVDVKGDHAFVATGDNGLNIVNINTASSPFLVGHCATMGHANDVKVYGDYAYVAVDDGLEVIDIQNMYDPYSLGFYNTSNDNPASTALSLSISGNHAFLATNEGGLQIFEISDPVLPSVVGSCSTGSGGLAFDVAIDGDMAYVIDYNLGKFVFNISDPTSPTMIANYGVIDTGSHPYTIAVAENYAFIGYELQSDLHSYYIGNPYDWDRRDYLTPEGDGSIGYDNFIYGNMLVQANYEGGVQVYNIMNPEDLGTNSYGRYVTNGVARGVYTAGDLAYVACEGPYDLEIVNIGDPGSPSLVGRCGFTENGYQVFVQGDYAYVAARGTGGLRVINVSDPVHPAQVGFVDPSPSAGDAVDVYVAGNYAYLADDYYGLHVIDISDPTNPVLFGTYPLSRARAVVVEGDYAYVAGSIGSTTGLFVIEISKNKVEQFELSSTVQSSVIVPDTHTPPNSAFSSATLNSFDYTPAETSISYFLSPDDGTHWEQVIPGTAHAFTNEGYQLKWKAVLSSADNLTTPAIFSLTVDYLSNLIDIPTLVTPGDGVIIDYNTPTLEWASVTNAISYLIQLDTSASFDSVNLINETIGMTTSYTHVSVLSEDTWYWRVAPVDSDGDLGIFSPTRSFTVTILEPEFLSQPSDLEIHEGDTGYSILWNCYDKYHDNYTVYRDDSVYKEGEWSIFVVAKLDDLSEGLHNFTCVIENIFGKTATDTVWITVLPALPDVVPPTITQPDNITFAEGSIGYSIIWSGSDNENPWWATVTKNSEVIYDQGWVGNDIEISLEDLTPGTYFYNCTLFDEAGNAASALVEVTVLPVGPDEDPPIIVPPGDTDYPEGTTGHYLIWTCSDDHPFAYSVQINETEIYYGPWHGENLNISCDGLNEGVWVIQVTLWDLLGLKTSDTAVITVLPPVPDTLPPTVSQPAGMTIAENNGGTIIWEVHDDHPGNYIVRRNATTVLTSDHWMSGIIQYSFDALSIGTWEFNLTVWDKAGNAASSCAIVNVVPASSLDEQSPQISQVADRQIVYGTTNNYVEFYLFDAHPKSYSLLLNDVQILECEWKEPNKKVIYSLDGLKIGTHALEIHASDIFDNTASRELTVTVTGDFSPPSISSPKDIVTKQGVLTSISWDAQDQYPSRYEIINLNNGSIVGQASWSGGEIIFALPDLEVGTYTFRCAVYDTSGNYAIDDVAVTVGSRSRAPGFEATCLIPVLIPLALVMRKRRLNK